MNINQKLINFGCSIGINDSNSVSFTNRFVAKPIAWMIANDGTHKVSRFIWREVIARIWAVTASAFSALTLTYHTAAFVVSFPLALLKYLGLKQIPETFSFRAIRENGLNASQSAILTVCGSIGGVISPEKLVKYAHPISERDKTPIFGYHEVSCSIEDPWTVSPKMFREHLQHLNDNNYELCTVAEFTNGHIIASKGKKLAVITFDDSHESQLRYLAEDQSSNIVIDPDCAVGVMSTFKKEYPDFRCVATFYINTSTNPSSSDEKRHSVFANNPEQDKYKIQKLKDLKDLGHEIGSHGHQHECFDKMTKEQIDSDIKAFDDSMKELEYSHNKITSFAWPFGHVPKKSQREAIDQRFKNVADFGFHAGKETQDRVDSKRMRRLFIGPNTGFSHYAR